MGEGIAGEAVDMIVVIVVGMALRAMIAGVVAMAAEGGTTIAIGTKTVITTMTMIVVVVVDMIVTMIQKAGHHSFTNPRLFNAFNGSVVYNILMILIQLYVTANIVRDCNMWTCLCMEIG